MVFVMSAKTPMGAMSMIILTSLMTTACIPSKQRRGPAFDVRSLTCTSAMPMSSDTKTSWSMLLLLDAEPKKLSGTMSMKRLQRATLAGNDLRQLSSFGLVCGIDL